jgi:hypothetical protein
MAAFVLVTCYYHMSALRPPAVGRRAVLGAAAAFATPRARAATEAEITQLAADNADGAEPASIAADANDISYDDLRSLLRACRESPSACSVERVVFTSPNGETGTALLNTGQQLPITGIPPESPTSDSSPARLVAKLRDAQVPFTFPFNVNVKPASSSPTLVNPLTLPPMALPKLPLLPPEMPSLPSTSLPSLPPLPSFPF